MQEDKVIFSRNVLQSAAGTALQGAPAATTIMNLTFLTHTNQDLITIPILMFLLSSSFPSLAVLSAALVRARTAGAAAEIDIIIQICRVLDAGSLTSMDICFLQSGDLSLSGLV